MQPAATTDTVVLNLSGQAASTPPEYAIHEVVGAPLAALDLPLNVLVGADDPRRIATPRRVRSLPATG